MLLSGLFKSFFILLLTNYVELNMLKKLELQKKLIADSTKPDPCLRDCVPNDTRICMYKFLVDTYTSMSVRCGDCPYNQTACSNPGCIPAGGIVRPVVNVNRALPGPAIQVCENDIIIVDVINIMKSESITIHWHGLHQKGTPYMDGTPYITQCPILSQDSFRYQFKAAPHGTHMWHGHVAFQESDGLFGALVVRRREPMNIKCLFDYDLPEHTFTVWHWYDKPNTDILPPILHQNGSVFGFGLLINGKAAFKVFEPRDPSGQPITTPREKFTVSKGKRYRFRVISNSAIYCPVQLSIDSHSLLVISSDTTSFVPVEADSLMLNAGERFSFVVTANQTEGCYWVRFRGMGDCGPKKSSVHQEAYLCYEGYDETPNGTLNYDDGRRAGVLVNPVEMFSENYSNNSLVLLTDLTSVEEETYDYSGTPDVIIYLQLHTRVYDVLESPGPWPQFNNISFDFPSINMLTQRDSLLESQFCGDIPGSHQCIEDFCSCLYTHKVPLNSLVEIVMVDISIGRDQDHPVHIHGNHFHVVAIDIVKENISLDYVRQLNEEGRIHKKLSNATAKDSISVPNSGYAIVRFKADNPGFWLFHCHVTNHMELGMAMILQVGSYAEMAETPSDFPSCGNWYMHKVQQSSSSSFIDRQFVLIFTGICIIIISTMFTLRM